MGDVVTEQPPELAGTGAAISTDLLAAAAATTTATVAAPREHLISTAITFLQNPGVKRNALNQKQQFLRTKGLTEPEIQLACERAGVFTGSSPGSTTSTVINMGISTPAPAGTQHLRHHHHHQLIGGSIGPAKSLLQHLRDVVSASALVAGVAYAIYMFYKNFIRPLLFGRGDSDSAASSSASSQSALARSKRRRKTPEELMEDMSRSVEKSVASINQELARVREEVARTARQEALHREIGAFKADLDAIKGLLLNRKQFTAAPILTPPSIPAWQLSAQLQQQQQQQQSVTVAAAASAIELAGKAVAVEEDAASGSSGSSETEVVNKNSDSSIEIL